MHTRGERRTAGQQFSGSDESVHGGAPVVSRDYWGGASLGGAAADGGGKALGPSVDVATAQQQFVRPKPQSPLTSRREVEGFGGLLGIGTSPIRSGGGDRLGDGTPPDVSTIAATVPLEGVDYNSSPGGSVPLSGHSSQSLFSQVPDTAQVWCLAPCSLCARCARPALRLTRANFPVRAGGC
jgi:hypothetical protein